MDKLESYVNRYNEINDELMNKILKTVLFFVEVFYGC